MHKKNLKELIGIILFAILNILISFYITNIFGISNIVIYKSLSFTLGDITYESIIFIVLSFIEALVYELFKNHYKMLLNKK